MKNSPTLADSMMREWLRPHCRPLDPKQMLASSIAKARKFMLNDDMSAFMADLAYASLLTCKNEDKAHLLLNGMRQMARLPHPLTWIEYNFVAKATRAVNEYGAGINLDRTQLPEQSGWLCWQHPQIDTAFMALECASHSFDKWGQREAIPQPVCFTYGWRTDDGPVPWKRLTLPGHSDPAGFLTGVMSYRSDSVAVCTTPHLPDKFVQMYLTETSYDPLKELSSDLRYLWALLATINDLPTRFVDVKQDRGYVARGRYRKFVDHTVVHLTIPAKAYKRIAQRAIAMARRRAHGVRGHWRKDWTHRPAAFCEHVWETVDNRLQCKHCDGRRLWIHAHQRGDASLGFVMHDYDISHPQAVP